MEQRDGDRNNVDDDDDVQHMKCEHFGVTMNSFFNWQFGRYTKHSRTDDRRLLCGLSV